jgi:hypothetical protein
MVAQTSPDDGVQRDQRPLSKLRRNSWSFDRLKSLGGDLQDDLIVLRHLWLSNLVPGSRKSSASHAQRLESFYGPQAAACEWLSRQIASSATLGGVSWGGWCVPGRPGPRQAAQETHLVSWS